MYIQYLIWWSGWWSLIADNIGVERLNMFAAKQETGAGLGRGCGKYSASGGLTGGSRGSRSSSSSSSSVLLSSPHKEVRMGGAALKTCCLYLCLIFLSGVILLTSFTIQWILYSIQFSLVSPQFSPVNNTPSLLPRKELEWSVWWKVDWRFRVKLISWTLCMPTGKNK